MDRNKASSNTTFSTMVNDALSYAAFHPLRYAKVLMQVGYEPFALRKTTSLFGAGKSEVYVLPSVFSHLNHIRRSDGFLGLYRGLGQGILIVVLSDGVSQWVYKHLADLVHPDPEQRKTLAFYGKKTLIEVCSRCTAAVVVHPLQVCLLRYLVQFVGHDEVYTWNPLHNLLQMWHQDGGFFAGLAPKLLMEVVTAVSLNVILYLLDRYVFYDEDNFPESARLFAGFCRALPVFLVQSAAYPLSLISTCMAVNQCGLKAGQPPLMPLFDDWTHCWRYLRFSGQLNRGSSIFLRRYSGPVAYSQGQAYVSPS